MATVIPLTVALFSPREGDPNGGFEERKIRVARLGGNSEPGSTSLLRGGAAYE